MSVSVHRNLNKKAWSVSEGGRVRSWLPWVILEDATFVVRQGGRTRALKDQTRNVHAYVRAPTLSCLTPDEVAGKPLIRVRYDFRVSDTFFRVDTGDSVKAAPLVYLDESGRCWIESA